MIYRFAGWIAHIVLGLEGGSRLGESIHYFLFAIINISFGLLFISFLMGIVNAYFPVERLQRILSSRKLYGSQYLFASLFGAVTPFCSCSSIPLFIGFVKGGIPLGVTFSFLITSPLINEIAIAMMLTTFGTKITIIYVISGILLGVVGGWVLSKFRLERYLSDWICQIQQQSDTETGRWTSDHTSFFKRVPQIAAEAWTILRGVFVYVVIGVAIGACMHGYLPERFFQTYLSSNRWYEIPLAVLLAIPVHTGVAGIIPVIQVLVSKGISLGTAIAFMMAVVGLSLPEAMMLKKIMKWKLIGIYFSLIAFLIILTGYLFNFV